MPALRRGRGGQAMRRAPKDFRWGDPPMPPPPPRSELDEFADILRTRWGEWGSIPLSLDRHGPSEISRTLGRQAGFEWEIDAEGGRLYVRYVGPMPTEARP